MCTPTQPIHTSKKQCLQDRQSYRYVCQLLEAIFEWFSVHVINVQVSGGEPTTLLLWPAWLLLITDATKTIERKLFDLYLGRRLYEIHKLSKYTNLLNLVKVVILMKYGFGKCKKVDTSTSSGTYISQHVNMQIFHFNNPYTKINDFLLRYF